MVYAMLLLLTRPFLIIRHTVLVLFTKVEYINQLKLMRKICPYFNPLLAMGLFTVFESKL